MKGFNMKKRPLGKTGLSVSEIAFGTVSLGMPYGIEVKGHGGMPPESESIKLLETALDKGVNFYDTARSYGCSEEIIGKAFKGRRDDVVIATKSSHFLDEQGRLYAKNKLAKVFKESLEQSLRALQTDYIDLYMSHTGKQEVINSPDIMELMAEHKAKGVIKAAGVSTYTPEETRQAIENDVWDVIQVPFNLMDQRQSALFDRAREKGVGMVVRSVLFKGVLTDRGQNLHSALKSVQQHKELYQPLLEKTGLTLPAMATKFVLSYDQVSSVLVGIDKMEYLDQALAVTDGNYFDNILLAELEKLAYPDPAFLDLSEWNKKGWLK